MLLASTQSGNCLVKFNGKGLFTSPIKALVYRLYLVYASKPAVWGQLPSPLPLPKKKKKFSSKEGVKTSLFVAFNIIINNIFPQNFIDIPHVFQKIGRIDLSILAIFINFHQFFGFLTFLCYKETNDVSL